ncbi:hypothetical protein ACF0H5_022470 [Mactra antiquata]
MNSTPEVNSTTSAQPKFIYITHGKIFDEAERQAKGITIWPLIFIFLFAVVGAVGNSIVIYIYGRKWKKNKTRIFILCLGVLDLINCIFNMPIEVVVLWYPLSFDLHYLCKISRGATFVINNTGSLVLVSIAIERLLLVYYPLKSRQLTPKFAKLMCLVAFVIASSVSWPSFVFYGSHTITKRIPDTNMFIKGKTCLISDEHEFRTGLILIFTTVLFTLLILIFILLTCLYIAIGRKIYIATCTDLSTEGKEEATKLFSKSIISAITGVTKPIEQHKFSSKRYSNVVSNQRLSSISDTSVAGTLPHQSRELSTITSSESVEKLPTSKSKPRMSRKYSTVRSKPTRKNTVMMRMVTIAFMLSFTPFLVILIIRYTNSQYLSSLNTSGQIAYHVFLRTYFINSMVNPLIYGFMNASFRKMVKQLCINIFCSKCCKKQSRSNYVS